MIGTLVAIVVWAVVATVAGIRLGRRLRQVEDDFLSLSRRETDRSQLIGQALTICTQLQASHNKVYCATHRSLELGAKFEERLEALEAKRWLDPDGNVRGGNA